MSVLCLHVPDSWDSSPQRAPWRWSDDQGGSGVADGPAGLPAAREVRLILPPGMALHALLAVPRRGRWQETLPYALEDRLLEDPDRLHVAAGPPRPDGRTPVVAVDRDWLRAAIAHAEALGRPPQSAFSAAAVEVPASGEWLVLLDDQGGVLIDQEGLPTVLDLAPATQAPRLLAARLAGEAGTRPQRLRLRARPGLDASALAATWSAQLPVPVLAGPAWTSHPGALPADCVNLLQGSLAPRRGNGLPPALRAAWQPVVVLLLASLCVWLLAYAVQTWQWQAEERQLAARSEAALRRAFPETRVILDPALQMARGLRDLQARAGVGPALGSEALLARVVGVADGLPARLRHLRYADQGLDLEWACPDPACSEALRQRLAEPARAIPAGAVQVEGGQVRVHLGEARP